MNLWRIFEAGRARRWHRHPVMADHDDRLDAHQGRVARIAKALFPDDHMLISAALEHDDGESATGDVPNPVKQRLPAVAREALDAMEVLAIREIWGRSNSDAPWCDPARLKLCDKLDAIMWVASKEPHLLRETGWQNDIAEALDLAAYCVVLPPVRKAISECLRRAG
jgi:hypothetical protein